MYILTHNLDLGVEEKKTTSFTVLFTRYIPTEPSDIWKVLSVWFSRKKLTLLH